jgi:hypothetical protein
MSAGENESSTTTEGGGAPQASSASTELAWGRLILLSSVTVGEKSKSSLVLLLRFFPSFLSPASRHHPMGTTFDSANYLRGLGWSGPGSSLNNSAGARAKPITVIQKKSLSGVGRDRDTSFQWWDAIFTSVASKVGGDNKVRPRFSSHRLRPDEANLSFYRLNTTALPPASSPIVLHPRKAAPTNPTLPAEAASTSMRWRKRRSS